MGLDLERRHRQPQGDDIDIDAAVEARVELAAGSAPDEDVYIDSVRRRRDLSVLILLDISGSAGEPSDSGGTVHEHQLAAAAALTQALHELGDRVALYGFRSQGAARSRSCRSSGSATLSTPSTCAASAAWCPAPTPGSAPPSGMGRRSWRREGGTARRLLVVLSDGFAYDHGYEGGYGEADARRALAEARRRGTACLCLSIGAGTDAAALRRVFGTAAHASIPRVGQLPPRSGRCSGPRCAWPRCSGGRPNARSGRASACRSKGDRV